MSAEFVDTNIIVYAFSGDPKARIARAVLERRCVASVQSLNEFVNVSRRKQAMDWGEIDDILKAIRILCSAIQPLDLEIHERAINLSKQHNFNIFDASLISAALRANCKVFHSEDMHHGMLVENQLRISNPFL